MSAEDKLLIQDAAVVGKVFWSGALGAVGGASLGSRGTAACPGAAADVLAAFSNRADEAYVRMRAAEPGAPAQLESAVAFYRRVKATAFERRASELLRGTA